MKYNFIFGLFFLALGLSSYAQENTTIQGKVTDEDGRAVPSVNISVLNTEKGTTTDFNGTYSLSIKQAQVQLEFSALGMRSVTKTISPENYKNKPLNITLSEDQLGLSEVVISGTRDRVSRKKAPVVVNTISPKLFKATNSISVSESLNFTPGVRLETNCQNCNTTAVRMNGLQGSYSQILINSRPVFSALNSVYGLEQIPTSILDRIEVVRGGGSALYGSNAIAGTINIITKEPVQNSWEINSNLGFLGGDSPDRSIGFNASIVSDDLSSGITAFGLFRDRDGWDANGDGFTEKTRLTNNTLGLNAFVKPSETDKFMFNFTGTKSFRRGGDRLDTPPQFSDITEQLDHNTIRGGITYEGHSKDNTDKYSAYISAEHTDRKSYYGGLFGGRTKRDSVLANKAFGHTNDLLVVGGGKYIHNFNDNNKITTGVEYKLDKTNFVTPGFNKVNDQTINTYGIYGQYTWKPFDGFTTLLGARLDNADVNGEYTVGEVETSADADVTVVSPRVTVMYNITDHLKFRAGYARGFRPPRAYDEDFEVSSAQGRQEFTVLSNDLETEYSNAYNASFNYSNTIKKTQMNFLLEGFYTEIKQPFTTVATGQALQNGRLLNEIQNGSGSYVTGLNFDFGVSPSSNFTAQIGGTLQKNIYKKDQILFEASPENPQDFDVIVDEYTRTPNFYGYVSLYTTPLQKLNFNVTGTYTGNMTVPHVTRESGFLTLEDTDPFFDLNLKLSRHIEFTDNFHVTVNAGVKNVFNSYQDDFDKGPTRDSDYIYGPSSPRTYFVGLTLGNL